MIIQVGRNLHAVMLLTIFLTSSLHLLYIILCEASFFLLFLSPLIQKMQILEVKFYTVWSYTCATFALLASLPSLDPPIAK